ncbi:hypothetical protein TNCV_839431 [Trichonephila clavipes]|nr:hypothetical protein TNCV_839431 [Trichonephila clavipes]
MIRFPREISIIIHSFNDVPVTAFSDELRGVASPLKREIFFLQRADSLPFRAHALTDGKAEDLPSQKRSGPMHFESRLILVILPLFSLSTSEYHVQYEQNVRLGKTRTTPPLMTSEVCEQR